MDKQFNFIAVSAIIETNVEIGDNTKVWYFSHLMEGSRVGRDCILGERVFLGRNVILGDNVKIGNGSNLYEGTIIRDKVFIGNNVSFTNVRYPRAWRKANQFLNTIVEEGATIGANAVITAGVRVGKNSTVGDGAIVINDVSDGGMVVSPKAECICNREECPECSKRKEKSRKKLFNYE